MSAPVTIEKKIPYNAACKNTPLPATIVLLHGWGFDSRSMQPLQTMLSQWAEVWLLNLSYSQQTTDALCEKIAELLPKNSILLGWSLGGMLAVNLVVNKWASKKNKSILGLITLAANAKFVADESWPTAMAPKAFNYFVTGFNKNPARQCQRFNQLIAEGDAEHTAQLPWLQANGVNLDKSEAVADLLNGLKLLEQIDNTQALKANTVPALYLFGENDSLVPSEAAAKIPCANSQTIVLKNRGHCLHYPVGEAHTQIENWLEALL